MATTRTPDSRDDQAQKGLRANQNPGQQQQGVNTGRETSATARESERGIQRTTEPVRGGVARRGSTSAAPYGSPGSPFSLMRRMAEDMDRIMEDFGFGPTLGIAPLLSPSLSPSLSPGRGSTSMLRGMWSPQLETFRQGDRLVVRADLPGLRKEDVNVEVDDGVLSISGHRAEEQTDDRDDYYRSERSYGEFYRALPLPEGVTGDECEATFDNGVLEVKFPLPKQQERKARRIDVK